MVLAKRRNDPSNTHKASDSDNRRCVYHGSGNANQKLATCSHEKTSLVAGRPHPPFGENHLAEVWQGGGAFFSPSRCTTNMGMPEIISKHGVPPRRAKPPVFDIGWRLCSFEQSQSVSPGPLV